MGFYEIYKAVFDAVATAVAGISGIKQVVKGERFKVKELPLAILNPEETLVEQAVIGSTLACNIFFMVIVLCRETEPEDWFADVISLMGEIFDAILADRTLGGAAKDVIPITFVPGEATLRNRLYYGGAVRFQAFLHYTP